MGTVYTLLLPPSHERWRNVFIHNDGFTRRFRFAISYYLAPLLSHNVDAKLKTIEIAPLQAHQFTSAHPGVQSPRITSEARNVQYQEAFQNQPYNLTGAHSPSKSSSSTSEGEAAARSIDTLNQQLL